MLGTQRTGRVVVAALSRPPVNALTEELLIRLDAVLDEVAADDEITVLHIRSDQKAFCAGADLSLMQSCFATPEGTEAMIAVVRRMQRLFERLENANVVTLAEVGGAALGGGLELALACDLRVAAAEAKLGLPEAGLGLVPAAGGTQRLTRLCGPGIARRLILGAEVIDGTRAAELGVVQWVHPREHLAARAAELAARIAAIPKAALEGGCMSFKDKIAVVTGAASGIGLATAHALASEGAKVIVADINAEKGEAAVAAIRGKGFKAEFFGVDLTSEASVSSFAEAVQSKVGAVDILVNGAGWGQTQPFWETTPDLWERVIGLNFVGPMRLVKALLPKMMERGSGKIVNIASDAGRVGSLGETVYSGAKGGLIAFTKSLARETARYGINVNCVCPGPTETPLLFAVPEKHLEAFKKAIPFRRFAKPSEIADAVVFFASERASYITGQVLSVSGGLTMVG